MAQSPDSTPIISDQLRQQSPPAFQGIEAVQPAQQQDYSYAPDQKASYNGNGVGQNPNPAGFSGNNYAMAMPLRTLQQGAAPVDCPLCGVREVTAIEYVSGNYTE